MNLIKYCNKIHRIDIAETIHLGTFSGYRNHEKNEIKDENEGVSDGFHVAPNETIHLNTPEQIKQFNSFQNGLIIKNTNPNITTDIYLNDVRFFQNTILQNCFLFSCAESPLNIDLMKKLGYDSYYEIIDTQKFCDLLTNYLGKKLQARGIYENGITVDTNWEKVEYTDSVNLPNPFEIKHHDFAKKKTKFVFQREYRLIFLLRKSNYQAITIEDSSIDLDVTDELRNCCMWK